MRWNVERYDSPTGILLLTWTGIYLFLSWFHIFVQNGEYNIALVLGAGLVVALVVTFVLSNSEGVE